MGDGVLEDNFLIAHSCRCATSAHQFAPFHMLGTVEQQHPHLLMFLVEHERAQVAIGGIGIGNLEVVFKLFSLKPACNLNGGEYLNGFYFSHTSIHTRQVAVFVACDFVNLVVVIVEDALAQLHNALPSTPASQNYGK